MQPTGHLVPQPEEVYVASKGRMKLGGGGRFAKVEASARKSGARNPAAVAAAVGRKKYGNAKMAKMSAQGRKRAAKRK